MRLHPALIALVIPALLLATPSPASAAVGDLGYDVSYPQCGKPLPADGVFAVVGVNGGLARGGNPCLSEQLTWASTRAGWELYVNTGDPGPVSANWPVAGTRTCATGGFDAGCAYEYGRRSAELAVEHALAQAAATGLGLDPLARNWWLDVETANSWDGTDAVDAAALQGSADGLRLAGVPEVGVYSTGYQWGVITGGYTRANAASYRAQWPAGLAQFPLEDGPVWFAGGDTLSGAKALCGTSSFTGGERLLAQYFVDQVVDTTTTRYDGDYRCADPDLTPPTAVTTGPSALVSTASPVRVSWGGTDTGGSGLASYDLRTTRAPVDGSFGTWSEPLSMQRLLPTYKDVSRPAEGWTACFTSRSRDAAGNLSSWAAQMRCTAVPLDDRRLTASTGWTRATSSGWFNGTSSYTTRYGSTLSRTRLVTKRLHLLALRCPTCGKVGVYVGGRLLTTVNLYSSTSRRVTIALPTFSLVRATVTLKVLTSGKPVRIDGLASSGR